MPKAAIEVVPHDGKDSIRIDDLVVRLPQGSALVAADDLAISAGSDSWLLMSLKQSRLQDAPDVHEEG